MPFDIDVYDRGGYSQPDAAAKQEPAVDPRLKDYDGGTKERFQKAYRGKSALQNNIVTKGLANLDLGLDNLAKGAVDSGIKLAKTAGNIPFYLTGNKGYFDTSKGLDNYDKTEEEITGIPDSERPYASVATHAAKKTGEALPYIAAAEVGLSALAAAPVPAAVRGIAGALSSGKNVSRALSTGLKQGATLAAIDGSLEKVGAPLYARVGVGLAAGLGMSHYQSYKLGKDSTKLLNKAKGALKTSKSRVAGSVFEESLLKEGFGRVVENAKKQDKQFFKRSFSLENFYNELVHLKHGAYQSAKGKSANSLLRKDQLGTAHDKFYNILFNQLKKSDLKKESFKGLKSTVSQHRDKYTQFSALEGKFGKIPKKSIEGLQRGVVATDTRKIPTSVGQEAGVVKRQTGKRSDL